jgi:2-polyprenyl-3-methyl-5-hydroxy-6-metoxy-1,4-benzoquinol methylase
MERHYWESKNADPNNSDAKRIELAERLIAKHFRAGSDCVVLDVGCSVGLFATHFSKLGYTSIGIDFDEAAIRIARDISERDGGSARFVAGDLSDASLDIPPLDIALCFDIFEHLHDDELGVLLATLKRALKPDGRLIFHTLPMQFDYIFWNVKQGRISIPWLLKPFLYMRPRAFEKAVRCYALLIDMGLVILTHQTWRDRIKRSSHCNPLTVERLTDILTRAGYAIEELETGFLTPQYAPSLRRRVEAQPITHRSLYGVCGVRKK